MGLLDKGLAKLTLEAYQGENSEKKLGSLKVLYNPESIQLNFGAKFMPEGGVNEMYTRSTYEGMTVPELSLDLILDTRGPRDGGDIETQLSNLRAMCFSVGENKDAPYLHITWGGMKWLGDGYFSGRAVGLYVSYTLFDRDAKALRATATLSIKGQNSNEMAKIKSLHAPLAKSLPIPDKTSLPLLLTVASTTTAGAAAYLTTAYANDVDNLSGLPAGLAMITP